LYVKARGSLRNRIYEVLLHFNEPDAILTTALADIGADALPALRVLARSRSPECEIFVSVIANLRGIPMQDRLAVLAELASNPVSDVRYCLLESLRALPSEDVLPLLTALSTDEDEEIASEARAWLESLEN
jgi:HEAT repeat protein